MTWVLLRGLTRERGHWGAFEDEMARAVAPRAVVSIDLPGAGTEHHARCPARVHDIAAETRRRLFALGVVEPLRLFGLSLGGMVAAEWASLWPAEVSHLVVVNTSMRPHGALHERLRPAAWLPLLRVFATANVLAREQRILRLTSAHPWRHRNVVDAWAALQRVRPVSRGAASAQLCAAALYRSPALPPSVRAAVLCSLGDRMVNPVCSRRLASAWGCPLHIHPTAGHDLPLDAGAWILERIAIGFHNVDGLP